MLRAEVTIKAQFYHLDPMGVVWHGNYVRFMEQARCALLDRIGYNYVQMDESGYTWPVVDMRIKFVRPVGFGQDLCVVATLVEYENRLKIAYEVFDAEGGPALTKAETVQVAVAHGSEELSVVSPPALVEKVRRLI